MASTIKAVRALLRATPDGMTVKALVEATGLCHTGLRYALRNMPDAYIDRWEPHEGGGRTGRYSPVYCVVVVPPDCPHPEGKDT